jgi:hypothetical protein
MNAKRIILAPALLAAALLAGCSASVTPQLIGSYPRYATPTAFLPPARALGTTLEIEVTDVDAASQQAVQLAYNDAGYLAARQSWYEDGRLRSSLALGVPSAHFDDLRRALVSLGRLVNEHISSDPALPDGYPAEPQSLITVTFVTAPAVAQLPALPIGVWSPAQTFAHAFAVFASIFTVLVDVLIWVGVVVGPFVLIGLGLRWLVRRARPPV